MPMVMLGFCEHLALPLAGELSIEVLVEVHGYLLVMERLSTRTYDRQKPKKSSTRPSHNWRPENG